MHIFMHTKIQKYAKNMQKKIYCVLKNQTFKKNTIEL
jgi:hypothetical protein